MLNTFESGELRRSGNSVGSISEKMSQVDMFCIFRCCFEDCTHPISKERKLENETWYPRGPSIYCLSPLTCSSSLVAECVRYKFAPLTI